MAKIGYARVSTIDQDLETQLASYKLATNLPGILTKIGADMGGANGLGSERLGFGVATPEELPCN